MLNYKHVLVATDLSKASREVLKTANELVKSSEAKISVVHVLEHAPVTYAGEFSIPIDPNLEQSLTEHARKILIKLGKDFQISEKDLYLETGTVRFAVMELAKKLKADLIIVGTHGHHGIDVLLGSRANAILHHAQCDVLTVRVKQT